MKLPNKSFLLLSFDSLAGVSAGCLTLLSKSLLVNWYGWSPEFTRFVARVNIGYGCYSGFLALRLQNKNRLSRWMVLVLIAGNILWAINCFFQSWRLHGNSSRIGIGHLVFEGIFVGTLAWLESRILLSFVGTQNHDLEKSDPPRQYQNYM